MLTSRTEATRAVPRSERVVPREPVPARRRPAEPAPAPARAQPRSRRSPAQILTILLILLLVGAGIGVAIAATQGGNQKVQLRQVVYPDTDQSVDAMKQLVDDNTR